MRLKYYRLCLRNQKNVKKKIIFLILLILIMISLIYLVHYNLEPKILALCDSRAKRIGITATSSVINDTFSDVDYDDLVTIKQDQSGKVTAINADVSKLNRLASEVLLGVQDKLSSIEEVDIKYPVASLFGESIFSGYGPKLNVKVIPSGTATVNFNSEFESAGINQTRHRISIQVKTNVRIIAPFFSKTNEYADEITIAESIIVGEVPASYYHITGVEGMDSETMLEFAGE